MSTSRPSHIAAAAGLGAAICLFASGAEAYDKPWDTAKALGAVAVRDRSRKAWDPDGVRIGNFRLYPEVGYGVTWSGTGTGEGGGRVGDFRHELFAGFILRSELPRHYLEIRGEGRGVQFQESDEIRYLNGGLSAAWRIDVDHATNIFGRLSTARVHGEDVDDERPKSAKRPPPQTRHAAELGLSRTFGRLDTSIGARYQRVEFSDVDAVDGSRIELAWQDYQILSPFAQLGYRISPGYRVFAEVSGRFQENRGNDVFDRDATGIQATAGLEMELTRLVRLTMLGGWLEMDYRQAGLLDISAPIWEGRLEWMVTPLVTMTLATRREVRATSYGAASGALVTTHALKVDYEMWRNLILTGQSALKYASYVGESREDTIWSTSIGAEYIHTKNWVLAVSYEHQELTSTAADYDRRLDKVGFSVRYRF